MTTKPYNAEETEKQWIEDPAVAYYTEVDRATIEKNREKLRASIAISAKQKEAGLGIDQEEFRKRPRSFFRS